MRLQWWSPAIGFAMLVLSAVYVIVLCMPFIGAVQSMGTGAPAPHGAVAAGFAISAALISVLGLLLGIFAAIRKVRPAWTSVAGILVGLLNSLCWTMFAVVTPKLAEVAGSLH